MGNYLNDTEHKAIRALEYIEGGRLPLVPWLDEATALYLRALVAYIADDIPTALAVILYGSMARHEERPLLHAHPSDVDVLVLFTPEGIAGGNSVQGALTAEQHHQLSWAVVNAFSVSPDAPRDVQVLGALTNFAHWDPQFVEQVARDGILLWTRGLLPPALTAIEKRRGPSLLNHIDQRC